MGRFREKFAGKFITFRIPYTIPGELVVLNGQLGVQFPEATFLHNVDKPFEIHRMILRLSPFDNVVPPAIVAPPIMTAMGVTMQEVLSKYVRIRVRDTSKNEALTKAAQLSFGQQTANASTWEWEDPYTLVRSEGMEVTIDNVCPNFVVNNANIGNLRIEVTFEGYLIVIAPASESR